MPLSISGDGTITGLSAGGLPNGSVTADDLASTLDLSGKTVTGLTNDSITEGNTSAEVVDTGSDGHFKVTTEGTERLRVDSSGNVTVDTNTFFVDAANNRVAVGTTIPGGILHVNSNDNANTFIASGSNGRLRVFGHSSSFGGPWISATNPAESSYLPLFLTGSDVVFAPAGTDRARIDSSGRFGLGTVSPLAPLHVSSTTNTVTWGSPGSQSQLTASVIIGDIATNAGGSLAVRTGALGTTYATGFGVDGTNDGNAITTINLKAFGTQAGGYGSALAFHTTNGTSLTERMRIRNTGNILMGTTSAIRTDRATLDVKGNSGEAIVLQTNALNYAALAFRDADSGAGTHYIGYWENSSGTNVGAITHNNSTTTYGTSSDYRLKENFEPLTDAISRVNQLKVHRFNFIANPDHTVDGFVAHEVQSIVPESVTGIKDEVNADGNPVYQNIDQSKIVPLLTAALQESLAKIQSLESRVAQLEGGAA